MSVIADHLLRLPHSPTAARAVAIALAALLLVLLARLLLLLLGEAQLPAATMSAAPVASAPAAGQPIANWHLFGLPGNAATPASETRLPLLLRGTIAASDPAQGSAFIADGNGREARYRVNDSLPGGARLLAVYPGRVLLDNAGSRETLSLRGSTAGGGRVSASNTARTSPDGGFLSGPLHFGAPDLQTQRAQRAPDIERLAEQANVLPVLENGRMIGVQVAADPALLERVGLERDDIVLAVNGMNLDDPQVLPALQNQLRAGGLITLTVRRGGRDLTLSLGL